MVAICHCLVGLCGACRCGSRRSRLLDQRRGFLKGYHVESSLQLDRLLPFEEKVLRPAQTCPIFITILGMVDLCPTPKRLFFTWRSTPGKDIAALVRTILSVTTRSCGPDARSWVLLKRTHGSTSDCSDKPVRFTMSVELQTSGSAMLSPTIWF